MTPHGPIRREQALRTSGAAGPHRSERPRSQAERAVINEGLADVELEDESPRCSTR